MRSGRRFAAFTVIQGKYMHLGVIRPGWDVEGGVDAQNVGGHCFFSTAYGERLPGWRSWEGMQTAKEQGDRIDMLFDLDQGSMAVCWR